MKVKGLSVDVYRWKHDCTNGGLTSRHDQFILIGEGIDGPLLVDIDDPPENTLILVRRDVFGVEYLHAEPLDGHYGGGDRWYMAGGNFVYTCDSRFPNSYPISVHDRLE